MMFRQRQPSEWINPRSSRCGCLVTMSCCQSARAIRRSCLRPGACCGKRHRSCFEDVFTSTAPDPTYSLNELTVVREYFLHCCDALADDARVPLVQRDPQFEHASSLLRQAAISEIQTKEIRVAVRQRPEIVDRAFADWARAPLCSMPRDAWNWLPRFPGRTPLLVMPGVGFEPTRPFGQGLLRTPCLARFHHPGKG